MNYRVVKVFRVLKDFKDLSLTGYFIGAKKLDMCLCCAANFTFADSLRSLKSLKTLRTIPKKYSSIEFPERNHSKEYRSICKEQQSNIRIMNVFHFPLDLR